MLARPLYEDKKPPVKFAPKTKTRRPESRAPHLVMIGIPLFLVLCVGGAVGARYMRATPAEEAEVSQDQPAAVVSTNTNGNQAAASSPGAPLVASKGASVEAPKTPAAAKPAGPSLPELDEFRSPVLSELDAATRMKRILELLDKGTSYEKAGAYHALLNMRAFAVRMLPSSIAAASEQTLPWLCDACGELKVTAADRPMITKALADPAKVPHNLVAALGKLATDECREFCLQSMKQTRYPALRQWAWESFVSCAKNDDLAMLSETLEKGEDYQRTCAADALGRLSRSSDVASQLARQFEARLGAVQDKTLRASLVRAVIVLPPAYTQSILTNLSRDPEPEIRILTVKGLARDTFTAGMLCSLLQTETNASVQIAIMKELAEAPQAEAVSQLLVLIDSNVYDISKAAQKALIAAYGVDYGYRAAPWKAWINMGEADGDRGRLKLFRDLERKRQADRLAALQAGQLVSGN